MAEYWHAFKGDLVDELKNSVGQSPLLTTHPTPHIRAPISAIGVAPRQPIS